MQLFLTAILAFSSFMVLADDLPYQPIRFELKTEKESYIEGEKVTFIISIQNTDSDQSYPVLLPHTQNTGHKLFFLNLYDKAENTMILRATEEHQIDMMVHDTGSVMTYLLKPKEQINVKIHWNDFDNYYNYHTQNSSHHSFGVPLFAGEYRINITYNPFEQTVGKALYQFYDDFKELLGESNKLAMPEYGLSSNFCTLKIRKSGDKVFTIEGQKYISEWWEESQNFWYYKDSVGTLGHNPRLVHITNLPVDSSSLQKGEYFYSHFTDIYAEYIVRFENGDIKEYRKYRDQCPDDLYTERYNEFKQKTFFAVQLHDRRFYSVSYHQPGGKTHQETYCSEDGTLCNVIDYYYNKKGEFVKTKTTETQPCHYDLEQKKSFHNLIEITTE